LKKAKETKLTARVSRVQLVSFLSQGINHTICRGSFHFAFTAKDSSRLCFLQETIGTNSCFCWRFFLYAPYELKGNQKFWQSVYFLLSVLYRETSFISLLSIRFASRCQTKKVHKLYFSQTTFHRTSPKRFPYSFFCTLTVSR